MSRRLLSKSAHDFHRMGSVSRPIDLGVMPLSSRAKDIKTVFTTSLLGEQHDRDCLEKTPAS